MGSSSRRFSFGGGGYAYQPAAGVESLEGVRIPIWSTKCVTARWFGPAAPLVDSELESTGTDRLEARLPTARASPSKMRSLHLANRCICWARSNRRPRCASSSANDHRNLSGHLRPKAPKYISEQPWNRENFKIDRSELMQAVMFHDSETTPANERVLSNGPLHEVDSDRATGAGSPDAGRPDQSNLEPDSSWKMPPSPPKIDQLTLVRIILPLKKEKNQGAPR